MMQANQAHKQPPAQKTVRLAIDKCTCNHIHKKNGVSIGECACGFNPTKIMTCGKSHTTKSKGTASTKTYKSNIISCSCKKSHCQKKYCACFALGQ